MGSSTTGTAGDGASGAGGGGTFVFKKYQVYLIVIFSLLKIVLIMKF